MSFDDQKEDFSVDSDDNNDRHQQHHVLLLRFP